MEREGFSLDVRLAHTAELFVGRRICDVGTDHAFLPIYLLLHGRIDGAVATEINEPPLALARRNAEKYRVAEKIDFRLCDGLSGADLTAVTDIAICGMGGEVISGILDREPRIKTGKFNLVLQPMTHARDLREYLTTHGYAIQKEALVADSKRMYEIINATCGGSEREYGETELLLGRRNIECGDSALLRRLASRRLAHMKRYLNGVAECDRAEAEKTVAELEKISAGERI